MDALAQPTWPVLGALLLAPIAGLLALALLPARQARTVSALAMLAAGGIAVLCVILFDPAAAGFQFVETHAWLPAIGVAVRLGVDGLSLFLLPLSVLLFAGVLVDAWQTRHGERLFHALLLVQLALTLAILCALDTLFFVALWEASLLPIYFFVTLWSADPRARHGAMQYVLLMLGGGALLLVGVLVAGLLAGRGFDLTQGGPLPAGWQLPVFLLFLGGLAAKLPVVPLHTWLPRLALASPAGVVAIFGGLKLAAYALLRLSLALTPDALARLHWLLAALGTVGILYGAVAAVAQTNLRTMLAYSGVAHVGLILLGLASGDVAGRHGAILLLVSLPVTTGGLYLLAAFLHRRTGSNELRAAGGLGGLFADAPRLTAAFLLLAFAAIGVPGLVAFPAELMIFVSALSTHTGAALAALFGAGIGAAALLNGARLALFGASARAAPVADLTRRELALTLVFIGLALAGGLLPELMRQTLPR